MVRPRVFISSTVYDFHDLRSALKYWLEESGYEVLMSESCDFEKDSSKNSYDACIETIKGCDYFVLLIGGRVGGRYDENTSITRKEYQIAYESAKDGRIKRIIPFVRQHIWDVLEDRKALMKTLEDLDIQENGMPVGKRTVAYHDSKLIKDAEHIMIFLDEVSRKEDFKKGDKPRFNWINSFTSFEDIIKVLTIELNLKVDMPRRVAERNIKTALARNLSNLTEKSKDGIIATFIGFESIRNKLIAERKAAIANLSIEYQIEIEQKENRNVFEAAMFFNVGVNELDSTIFEDAVKSGNFMTYSKEKETYIETGVCKALNDIIFEIKYLQRFAKGMDSKDRERILVLFEKYRSNNDLTSCYPYDGLASFAVIYERKFNILQLTRYMFNCFKEQNDSLEYPLLLHGLTDNGRPSEEDVLSIFEA